MVLAPSLSNGKLKEPDLPSGRSNFCLTESFSQLWRSFAVAAALILCAPIATATPGQPLKSYDSFSGLRGDILDFISGATAKVWMHSDFLTDGEIVTSLFVAKYRKIDVKVLLGKKKSNAYMSRLNYLKNQNISVYLKPDSFKTEAVTAILCDNELIFIDGELDFMSRYKKFNVYRASAEETAAYVEAFAKAANLEVPAIANAIPLVGRANANTSTYKPVYSGSQTAVTDGTFNYGKERVQRPQGVAERLPKETKWQKADALEAQDEQPVPELPADN